MRTSSVSSTAARLAAVALLALACLGLLAAPAAAHGRGSDATSFRSTITAEPGLPGVEWRIYGSDEYLWASNEGPEELVILGYEQEDPAPYLRIGPEGVFENRNSPAAYLNADRYARVEVPPSAQAGAAPDWVKVSDRPVWAWHDHRIHWMAETLPPQVTDPSVETLVQEWTVAATYGGEPVEVAGDLRWIPPPSPVPVLLLASLLVLPALAGLRHRGSSPPTPQDLRALARPAAVVLAVITLANVSHLVDDFVATPVPLVQQAFNAGQTLLFLGIATFGVVRAWQGGDGAFTALGVGAGALLIGQGLLYAGVLGASQTASLLPDAVSRLVIAASIVQVVPVGIVAVVGNRRLLPPVDEVRQDPARQAGSVGG